MIVDNYETIVLYVTALNAKTKSLSKKERRKKERRKKDKADKNVHAFPDSISPKVNVIARLEYEPMNNNIVVRHVNHYAMGTCPMLFLIELIFDY